MVVHPLHTDIPGPERFTYPFCYEPHPLAVLAAEEVKRELSTMHLTEGKMFGVLVVEDHGDRSLDSGQNHGPVPLIQAFKEQQYDKLAEHVRKYVDIPRLYQILSDD